MNQAQLREFVAGLGATMTPEQYMRLNEHAGRTKVYEELRAGTFPHPVIKHGRHYCIPTAPVLQKLGLED
jgi:hypothetical protein